jgi:hypothetical protein
VAAIIATKDMIINEPKAEKSTFSRIKDWRKNSYTMIKINETTKRISDIEAIKEISHAFSVSITKDFFIPIFISPRSQATPAFLSKSF